MLKDMSTYTVGAVAKLAGVSVRTLRHYDEVGLLQPSERSDAGYRHYSDADLRKLQQILFYRSLDFSLEQISDLMNNRKLDSNAHFRKQRQLLIERRTQINHMINVIDHTLEAEKMGIQLTGEERLEVFGDFNPDDYADETQQRWGNTDAYRESQRRTSKYTKADWQHIQAESAQLLDELTAAMQAGKSPEAPEAMALAEQHRQQITKWFYDCTYEIHTGLAQMYLADDRFTQHYEKVAEGLAQYLHDAIMANAITNS